MRALWYHGTVVSMDGSMRRYEAVGAEDGKIVFLGTDRAALAQSWDETTDLRGAYVFPGFNDTHMHLLHYALFQKSVRLAGAATVDEVVERCRRRIEAERPAFLIGMGWNQETLAEGRLVNRQDMDRVSTEIPVCMLRTCGHVAACNSVMLERIRALRDVDPETISHVDFVNGILREDAMRLYMDVLPQMDEAFVRELILEGQKALNRCGITCVHSDDLKVIPGMDALRVVEVFREMEAKGELTVRVYEQCLVDQPGFDAFKAVRSPLDDHTSLFRTGPRKLLQDGSLGAKSAEMIDGYADDPENHGIPIYTDDELYRWIKAAHGDRMNVAVHAIGDLALQQVCDAVERVQREDPWPEHRHGIVHAQTTTPALLRRMKDLGLQAYIQPIFIEADMDIIAERVGEAHARDCYNWKAMEDLGIRVSGGSDCPVEPFDILDNLRAAVTRKNRAGTKVYLPGQALTVEQGVRLFTSDAAWASYDEDHRGTLETGKLADLVVLDRDLFAVDPDDFPKVAVLETVLSGRTVYHAEGVHAPGGEMLRRARAIEAQLLADRRHLHSMPEVGVYLPQTAEYVKKRLTEMGIEHRDCGVHSRADREALNFAGFPDAPASTGVVGLIGREGPCILLRADMDGLPIRETAELPFASQNGAGHMCGHDMHTAMLLGAARILKDMEEELPGRVKLMFQPGEEMGYGSRTMVEDGLLENPGVEGAVALHVQPQLEVGRLEYAPGVASGAMATFLVNIQGRGGHSSEPQKTVDPLNIANQLCSALNLLIPREVDPEAFATLTVGALNSGRSSNIIPDTAELMISFRTLSPAAYDHLLARIPEILEHYIKAWRGTYSIRVMKTPSTICNPEFSAEVIPSVEAVLGAGNTRPVPPSKGAEDFAHVTQHVPGFYAFLGAGSPEGYPLHNPNVVLDERVLPLGSAILANCAVEWLRRHAKVTAD